jgi:hypothetical protein
MPKHTKSAKLPTDLAAFIERGQAAQEAVNRIIRPPALPRHHTDGELRYQGIAAALGELARAHMEPDLALMVLDSLGISLSDLKSAGADAYDQEALQDAQAQER